jgi:hypothetical protein
MSEEMKIVLHRQSEVSIKSCNEDGTIVKKCFAKLTLECGKIDSCDYASLSEVLVIFATDMLIEARELGKEVKEED